MSSAITVLQIDDESSYVELQRTFLEDVFDIELDLLTATAVAEGEEILEDERVDCVVCDYDMPGTDGLEFLERVRRSEPYLPFVLLTGAGNESVASEAIRHGVTDYVTKPAGSKEFKTLANRIRGAVERYRCERSAKNRAEHLATCVDRLPYPVLGLDGQLRPQVTNEAATAQFGLAEDTDNESVLDLLPSLEGQAADALRSALDDGKRRTVAWAHSETETAYELCFHPDDHGLTIVFQDA